MTAVATPEANLELDFIEQHLILPNGKSFGQAFERDPWQRDFVFLPILAMVSLVWLSLHRGAGKTTIAAAIAITRAIARANTLVICVAADLDQALLLMDALRGFCRMNALLASAIRQTKHEFTLSNASRVRVMSSDAASFFGQGLGVDSLLLICDEVVQWQGRELFDACLSTLPKVEHSQLVVLSNAGLTGSWQEEAFESFKQHGYVYAPPGVVASWMTADAIERQRAVLPASSFARLYENVWTGSTEEFVSLELWDSCREDLPPLDARTPVVAGVDAAYMHDSFAIVICSQHPDVNRYNKSIAVRETRVWIPDGRRSGLDFNIPLGWLAEFRATHNLVCVTFDAYQLHQPMRDFRDANNVWCLAFPQGTQRLEADVGLLNLIVQRLIAHDGNETLREHIGNCKLQASTREDTRARLVKSGANNRIDAAVALSMCAYQVKTRLNLDAALPRVPQEDDGFSPEYRAWLRTHPR